MSGFSAGVVRLICLEVKFSEVFYSEKGKKQCTHNREEKERVLNVDMTLVEKTPVGHFR